ncbi:MAG: DUF1080 domain-containing protein [Kiritimatiellae bacterium]|nr:DUF1080 domain-containing protein [Kiritimatiellia bacterium]
MRRVSTFSLNGLACVLGIMGHVAWAASTVDFGVQVGKMRPELYSSGFGPMVCSCPQAAIDDIRSMGFKAARTHDWALLNSNERVCDVHHIFPLMHLDAADPKNYVFGPTDYLLKRAREEAGLDIFFRLGTSIEHSGPKIHFNSLIPVDFEKMAEVFAATVRHYNHGWGNGHQWGIKYWEIWNEPDGVNNMWCLPEGDIGVSQEETKARNARRAELFAKFFAICLKRLKNEFGDEIKVGGPALCWMNTDYFKQLFKACQEVGVAPDFISWHHYAKDPAVIMKAIDTGRVLCDQHGFTKCELIINEWHFFGNYSWSDLRSPDPVARRKAWEGPHAHNDIDSSAFNLTMLSKFQHSKLDQAYYYGCRHSGSWGFKDEAQVKYNVYHSLKLFGDFIRDYPVLCVSSGEGTVTTLAGKSADGKKCAALVTDYLGTGGELVVKVAGVPVGWEATAVLLDHERKLEACAAEFSDGLLKLRKRRPESAAFCVTFAPREEPHPTDLAGWEPLLKPDLSNVEPQKEPVWSVDAAGCLVATKDVNLVTQAAYTNFALDLEFQLAPGANAGVFIYASDLKNWIPNKIEVQLLDNSAPSAAKYPAIWKNAALYGHQAPYRDTLKPVGEWNRLTIYCRGKNIRVAQNGAFILEADLARFTDVKFNPDGSEAPKWHTRPYAQLPTCGRIGFQGCHGGIATKFRNVRVKKFD